MDIKELNEIQIDENIKHLVYSLNKVGFKTAGCCAGHVNGDFDPYVLITLKSDSEIEEDHRLFDAWNDHDELHGCKYPECHEEEKLAQAWETYKYSITNKYKAKYLELYETMYEFNSLYPTEYKYQFIVNNRISFVSGGEFLLQNIDTQHKMLKIYHKRLELLAKYIDKKYNIN